MHLAHRDLLASDTFGALAGGANAMLLPVTTVAICQLQVMKWQQAWVSSGHRNIKSYKQSLHLLLQALSLVGRCRTFDALGDGYGRGEGFSVVYLSHSKNGIIQEVSVQGSAVNQDGQSSSLTSPNGPSQTQLMLVALRECLQPPARLTFVATHGTGTQLGDPIEVGAAVQAVRDPADTDTTAAPVTLCALKQYYGHTEGAAGVAGFLAAVQAAKQLSASPCLHLRSLNPYVQAAMSHGRLGGACPVQIPRQPQSAQLQGTLSGTSSFGMSGVNAHALVTSAAWQGGQHQGIVQGGYLLINRQRLWPAPTPHNLLCAMSTAAAHGTATFSCVLTHPLVISVHDLQIESQTEIAVGGAMEFMAAAAASLSASATQQALADIIFKAPLFCASKSVMNCSISTRDGRARLGDAAQARLDAIAQGGTNPTSALCGRPLRRAGYFSRPLQVEMYGSTIATMAAGHRQASCIDSRYIGVQAAIGLLSVQCQSRMRACNAYSRADISDPLASASAYSKGLSLLGWAGTTVSGLHELDYRAEATVSPCIAPAQSPAWELLWQPYEAEAAQCCTSRMILVVSSQVCSLCKPADSAAGVALNAVWNSVSGSSGYHIRVEGTSAPDLFFGAEAQLLMLVQTLEPRSQCLFVQDLQCLANTALALMMYRTTVAVSDLQLSLVTTDSHKGIGSFGKISMCETAILKGEDKGCLIKRPG